MRTIHELLEDFDISDEEIVQRKIFNEYAVSLASVLVDEWYSLYIKPNKTLRPFLEHTDGAWLLKRMKDFIVFIFSAPMDASYLERIKYIGFIHFSVQLPPSKVSYGFWALNQLVHKMAEVNDVVKHSKNLISKILALVEFVVNESYYEHDKKRSGNTEKENQFLETFDQLYSALQLHRVNNNQAHLCETGNLSRNDLNARISSDPLQCSMGKVLTRLHDKKEFIENFAIDMNRIEALHVRWHECFCIYIAEGASQDQYAQMLREMDSITEEILTLLDLPLKEYANNGFLSLTSGIKAIRFMTELFHLKSPVLQESDFGVSLGSLQENFGKHFSWAFSSFVMRDTALESIDYDLYRVINYSDYRIYVGIIIKEGIANSFLLEILSLLFEVLEVNLSIKERERSLMRFADKAESANRAKDIFLANMSHELRTPLNAITGFSQILMMRPDTPDSVKKYVEKINIAGSNLLNLVNTILDFAKLESGKMQFNPQLSNLSTLLNEVETLVTPMAAKKSIHLTFPNVKSLNLLLDANLIKQVFINLMSNAIKFTPDQGKVILDLQYDAEEKEYRFSVCDNGIGISKENQKSLFQPFSQVENVYQKDQKGTGLGLMISKKIIEELHQGRLWIESEEGEGSCFYITLPIPSMASHTYSINEADNSRELLVVEDSVAYQNIIADHLKTFYNITFTDTVNRAKELLISNRYDFILLDYFLIDGVSSEILQFMDEEHIDIACIVISAEDDIHIAQSLKGYSNLQSILSKNDIEHICSLLQTAGVSD
jgi:signal transduction histidine kinase